MAAELTSAEYAYLIILKAEGGKLSNTEMHKIYEVRLKGLDYQKLNADGYVVTTVKPTPYRHAITDKGLKALKVPLAIEQGRVPEGEKRSPGERQLFWAAMVAQQKLLSGAPERVSTDPPAQVSAAVTEIEEPVDLDGRIRDAYTKLAGGPGKWVSLTALRPLVGDVSKSELDKALVAMLDAPDVRLEPEPFGHRIGAEERSAAVHIGGEDRHKLAIGRR